MKFSGNIGFATSEETVPGVWVDTIVERQCRGEILQNQNRWQNTEQINDNFQLDNKFSIVLDAFLQENWTKIRYLKYQKVAWEISKIEIKHPRLILTVGSIYHG